MKVLVLNSGGFDSVTLMHHVHNHYKQEIVSVFFDYGQKNLLQEQKKALAVAEKLGAYHVVVELPDFDWSTNSMFDSNVAVSHENDYIHMRNMVFFSYALSIAQAQGCERIYAAIIDSENPVPYADTSRGFIKNVRKTFLDSTGIRFEAPFRKDTKWEVAFKAYKYGITNDDYFSCNHPVNGKPCGECGDCKSLKKIAEYLDYRKSHQNLWALNGMKYSPEFEQSFMNEKIVEMRVHNNNICNFHCSHCYYGFEDTYRPDLTDEEWFKLFDKSIDMGIRYYHFSGKEAILTKNFWTLTKYLHDRNCRYDFVTNGSTVERHIDKIKEWGFYRVCVSIDSMKELTIRDLPTADKAINILRENDVPVTVYIDVHKKNYEEVIEMIIFMIRERNVKNIYVRPVMFHGAAKDIADIIVTPEQWAQVMNECCAADSAGLFPNDFSMVLAQPLSLLEGCKDDPVVAFGIENITEYGLFNLTDRIKFFVDFYPASFANQITVTSDGYVVGIGTEMSSPTYYDEVHSPGNVLDEDLETLITRGKKMNLNHIRTTICNEGKCKFCKMSNSTHDPFCYSGLTTDPK